MENKQKLTINKDFFDVTYSFHLELEKSEEKEQLLLKDVTVKGQSIIRVMDKELVQEAYDEFYSNLIMQAV